MKIVFCLLAFVALVDTVVFAVAPVYRGVGQPIVVNAGIDAKQYIIVLNYPVLVYPVVPAVPTGPISWMRSTTPQVIDNAWTGGFLRDRLQTSFQSTRHLLNQFTFNTAEFVGFSSALTPLEVAQVALDPTVRFIEEDRSVRLDPSALVNEGPSASATTTVWSLDRIDQRALPLSGTYTPPTINGQTLTGRGVTIYILDTGLASHTELPSPRCQNVANFASDGIPRDCAGHGTHVAGTAAGTRVGVAPEATIRAIKVLNCDGGSSWSAVLAGMSWAAKNKTGPSIASMSLGGGYSQSVNLATANLASLMPVSIAAGNNNADASNYSPSSSTAAGAITVGATTSSDARASYSDYGSLVDVFAPGSNVYSTNPCSQSTACTCTNCYSTKSGTSMSTPLAAGAAALYLQLKPQATPSTVATFLRCASTKNKITSLPAGTNNRLLYVGADSALAACI